MTKGAVFDGVVNAEDVGAFADMDEKVAPVDADLLIVADSEDSNARKKVQIGNLPSSGGVTDHGALTGLADNDHPQYTLSATVDPHIADARLFSMGQVFRDPVIGSQGDNFLGTVPVSATIINVEHCTLGTTSATVDINIAIRDRGTNSGGVEVWASDITVVDALSATTSFTNAWCDKHKNLFVSVQALDGTDADTELHVMVDLQKDK
jgi:hypothetical protein